MKNTKCLYPEGRSPEGMVSVSQLQTHMSCEKKWEYNYVHTLTPRVERSYLSVGKLCHKGMQTAMVMKWQKDRGIIQHSTTDILGAAMEAMDIEWSGYMDGVEMNHEEELNMEQVLRDARSVFEQAFWEFDINKYEVLSVYDHGEEKPALELHFLIPCAWSKGLHGYIDAILRDKETGFVWCTDYKFRKSLSPDDEEAFNVQNAVYTRACRAMGINITGTMTWQHCNTPAAEPQRNKDGSFSRAKIRTTWDVYAKCVSEAGLDPEDYRDEMESKLAGIEWFRATFEYRNDKFVDAVWRDVIVPASRAVKSSYTKAKKGINKKSLYPWNCKMCQYQPVCQAELRGYDVQYIMMSQYSRRNSKPIDNGTVAVV